MTLLNLSEVKIIIKNQAQITDFQTLYDNRYVIIRPYIL